LLIEHEPSDITSVIDAGSRAIAIAKDLILCVHETVHGQDEVQTISTERELPLIDTTDASPPLPGKSKAEGCSGPKLGVRAVRDLGGRGAVPERPCPEGRRSIP
jgi:hypothetical protein